MSARSQTLLWLAQRISAALLAIAIIVHLVTIIGAVQGGLNAADIMARLQDNAGWGVFYLLFVYAAAVHGPIGLRTVLMETTPLPQGACNWLCGALGVGIAVLGTRAIAALVWGVSLGGAA